MHDWLRSILLLAAVFLLSVSPAFAQKKSLAELTVEDVQARVKLYLAGQGQAVELAEVVIDVEKIKFRKGTESVYTLEWAYSPAFGELPPAARKVVERKLQDILEEVLTKFQGGLVARQKQEKITYRFVQQAAPPRPTPTPAAPPTTYQPVWRLVCGCCGSRWVVEWYPSPASSAPAAAPPTGPERLGAPKPAAFFAPPVVQWSSVLAARTGASQPIVVERGSIVLPAEAQRDRMAVVGAGATRSAPATEARPWELRVLGDDELLDDYPKDAMVCYALGRAAYLRRDYGEARAYLTHAVELDARDARFWYFKTLAELAMGRRDLASASVQHGKDLEARGLPAGESIRLALEGVPAAARQFLTTVRTPTAAQPLASAR